MRLNIKLLNKNLSNLSDHGLTSLSGNCIIIFFKQGSGRIRYKMLVFLSISFSNLQDEALDWLALIKIIKKIL